MSVEAHLIRGAAPHTRGAVKSKQLRDPFTELYARNIAMEPPFDPELWARLTTISTRLTQLIRVYARNVAGQGWKIVPAIEVSMKTSPKLKEQVDKDMLTLKEFYGHPHTAQQSRLWEEESFSELLYKMVADREAIGNGYLEVSRDIDGTPAGIWHIPGTTVRIKSDLQGYVQYSVGRSQYVFFKAFGDPRIMDKQTGEFIEGDQVKDIPLADQANEIIHFQLYSPMSTHYGLPRSITAEMAITGTRAADERNRAFFVHDAVPRMAVLVSGGSISEVSLRKMESVFAAGSKKSTLAHRAIVLHAKPGQAMTSPATIKLEPLTVGDTDDASFQKYRDANNNEVREAFGLSNLHLGTEGSANRASAMAVLRLVIQQELLPAIRELEYRLNATITRALGVKLALLELRRPKGTDPLDDAKILQRLIPAGALTPNDLRSWVERALGIDLAPYTEDWTQIPFTLLLTLIRGQLTDAGEDGDKAIESVKQVIEELGNEVEEVKNELDW